MSYMDATAAAAALKVLYDDQRVAKLFYEENALLALIPKFEDFGGSSYPIPVAVAAGQSRSATFATAQANQTAALLKTFQVTRTNNYAVASITNEMIEGSRTDKMAFLRLGEEEIDTKMQGLANDVGASLFKSGTGSICQNNTATFSGASGVITLSDPNMVTQFEYNMTLQAASTDGGTPRAALGYVIAVDRMAGTVTVAASGLGGVAASPSGWAQNDYLLVQGDSNLKAVGLAGWLPATKPTPGGGDSFFTVDRSIDPTRLSGLAIDGSAYPISEALIKASMYLAREGAICDVAVTNHVSWGALAAELSTKVVYETLKGPAGISFEAIVVSGQKGKIRVIADRSCPGNTAYVLTSKSLKLLSLNQAPHIVGYGSADPAGWLRISNADAVEARGVAYYNLGVLKPGQNAYLKLAA